MIYYLIDKDVDNNYNSGYKARSDVSKILSDYGLTGIKVDFTKDDIFENKKCDCLVIQYPFAGEGLKYYRYLIQSKHRPKLIAFVHDLDYIRMPNNKLLKIKVYLRDRIILKHMDVIIAHNDSMKRELIKLGVEESRIVTLDMFDYLADEVKNDSKSDAIAIAANLSPKKAGYLKSLKDTGLSFNLYGTNLDNSLLSNNVKYKGVFKPEELPSKLEGKYGLVWDGPSIKTCKSGYGKYLKYNNPHKASLYVASNIPLIVWSESAMAKYVIDNNIGIVVDSLENLRETIDKVSDKEYTQMLQNVKALSKKVRSGYFIKKALDEAMK